MKFYILLLKRFLIKKRFGHVISQDMEYYKIGDTSAHS